MTKAFAEHSNEQYGRYIHISRYARWVEEKGRRETWEETVGRYVSWMQGHFGHQFPQSFFDEMYDVIYTHKALPSMRALMTAGEAANRNNIAIYNCSYVAADSPDVFVDTLNILLHGTGLGFSVERQEVCKLPDVPHLEFSEEIHTVEDSKEGWVEAYRKLIGGLYAGKVIHIDVSKVRPAGSRLKTFGGRASGPGPFLKLCSFTVDKFMAAQGRKLNSLEVHDILCMIGNVVVVGGVRRAALISLSNLSDQRLRDAKAGNFGEKNSQRYLSNNSVAYTEKPDMGAFLNEMQALFLGKSGERGIFNRKAAEAQAAKTGRRAQYERFGLNPCGEIILRSKGFCNLTEAVLREGDEYDTLLYKVKWATILGTLQSYFTNFKGLSEGWKENAEEERLLGVSLTGIEDWIGNGDFRERTNMLSTMRKHAVKINQSIAAIVGINASASITCVKPSGTVSQLVDSSSGMHDRFSQYYIRRVRADAKDPLAQFMLDQGVPCEPDVTNPQATWIFSFPMKSPVAPKNRSAIEQLELWKALKTHWCEHNPSCTVYYTDEEFLDVIAWCYRNFDELSGVSFLPKQDHVYLQAPYEAITEEEYNKLLKYMPANIDWTELQKYESSDNTAGSQTLACSAGACEIVDLTNG